MSVFTCFCASEECAVLGCKRWRDLAAKYGTLPGPTGWMCPACGKGNAPGVTACAHCAAAEKAAAAQGGAR